MVPDGGALNGACMLPVWLDAFVAGRTVPNSCVFTCGYSSPGSGLGWPMMTSVAPSYTWAAIRSPLGATFA